MSQHQETIKTSYFSIFGNLGLAIIKALAGIFGHSYALIADAIESTADIFSSLIVLLGLKYAKKPADENHPYGHGRIEPLVTFLVVGFLIISAIIIGYESIQHIITPHKSPKPWTLIVIGGIIVWKELSYRLVSKKSNETNSSSLKADAWHHRSDALTSGAAFLGIGIAVVFGPGYETADDWAALFATGIILYNSYRIFRPALGEVMDEHLYEDLIAEIRSISVTVEGILDTEKCYIRKSGMRYFVDLHAIVNGDIPVRDGHKLAHDLKDTLLEKLPEIDDVLIHIEPEEMASSSSEEY
ncbi:cation diffusion facilitator family transporter [Roseivirga pacifica]|uniref:Cation diffusion facilitator family transporter n=1 Tax=Roseivirga pacifica TaxID=1267423 RepID=A0A1I0QFP0_9BACT|nr:cation diffusion facilitator family transporter [Roseivirga pacifica]RKQ42976.1 cation diffusion facilitator family transporter [Roseivirga pacifica]SEW25723.1 cation diffusion facilitator family transporter [Roseivirga pacifica]